MSNSARIQSWDSVARGLHWAMAALLVAQMAIGWLGQSMDRSPARVDVMTLHKSLGVTLLLLLIFRLAWRWSHPGPPPPGDSRVWEMRTARVVHMAMYLLMFALPLSGLLAASAYVVPWKWWWLLPVPRLVGPDRMIYESAAAAHEYLLVTFLVIVALHVLAALWHHFVRRDGVLAGMTRGTPR